MTDEDQQIMRAVERFAGTVTVPVLHEYKPDEVDQVGTGTLFDVEGRLLFVTAGHLFDEIKAENLVIPSTKTKALHGIGPYELIRADVDEIDIAVVELKHPPAIARARWVARLVARQYCRAFRPWPLHPRRLSFRAGDACWRPSWRKPAHATHRAFGKSAAWCRDVRFDRPRSLFSIRARSGNH